MDGDFVPFSDEFFKRVNVGDHVDSEEFLIIFLYVFNLEGFHLLDSDILLHIINLLVSVDNFFNKPDHFFDTLNIIFMWVDMCFLEDSFSENVNQINFKIFFQDAASWCVDLCKSFRQNLTGFWIFS